MKKNLEILDCTLRDGGYYTNWNFDSALVEEYMKTLSKLPVSIIEPGYLSNAKDNKGPFYHLNNKILKMIRNVLNSKQKIFVMINLKEFSNFNELSKLINKNEKFIDGVRFAVNPDELNRFKKMILSTKKKFKKIEVCLNLMYASQWIINETYSNRILQSAISISDNIYLVDSYGAFTPKLTQSIFKNSAILKTVSGVHFHNNLNLAFANTIIAIENGIKRADSTLTGMGRGAGNAETELLLPYLKKKITNTFELNKLLESFHKLKAQLRWGPSYAYAYAARNGFSQAKMMNLIQNKRLEPSLAIDIINQAEIPPQKIKVENNKAFKDNFKKNGNTPIVLGGGDSILKSGKLFLSNLKKNTLLVLSSNKVLENLIKMQINFKTNIDILLVLTGNEFSKIKEFKKISKMNIKYILTEKSFFLKKNSFFKNKNVYLINSIAANPLLASGIFLKSAGFKEFGLAFFDGGDDYDTKLGMLESEQSLEYLKKLKLKIHSYTSTYLKLNNKNIWIDD